MEKTYEAPSNKAPRISSGTPDDVPALHGHGDETNVGFSFLVFVFSSCCFQYLRNSSNHDNAHMCIQFMSKCVCVCDPSEKT